MVVADGEKKKYLCAVCGQEFPWTDNGFNEAAQHEQAELQENMGMCPANRYIQNSRRQ